MRGQGSEVGRHWNDGSLGARARFEEKANPQPLLWIEDLRDEDEGTYRCRVDFKHAPTQNFRINLLVIGKRSTTTEYYLVEHPRFLRPIQHFFISIEMYCRKPIEFTSYDSSLSTKYYLNWIEVQPFIGWSNDNDGFDICLCFGWCGSWGLLLNIMMSY